MRRICLLLSALCLVYAPQGFASAGGDSDTQRLNDCNDACSAKLREDNEKCWIAQKARYQVNKADTGNDYRACMRQATDESLLCFEKCLGIDAQHASQ